MQKFKGVIMNNLPDVQQSKEGFPNIKINKVGIRQLKASFLFAGVYVLGDFSIYCDLAESVKGINMSRMARTLNDILTQQDAILSSLAPVALALGEAHKTDHIYIKCRFDLPFFDESPITHIPTRESLPVVLETILVGDQVENFITIIYTGMSLCPCSREMSLLFNNLSSLEKKWLLENETTIPKSLLDKMMLSGFGAHNQKSRIEIKVQLKDSIQPFPFYLKTVAAQAASSPVYSALRREDEKYITETSYCGHYVDQEGKIIKVDGAGAKFVEDIARQVAEQLNPFLDQSILDYVVVINNEESIHSQDIVATAILSAGRNLK
jgi:GTP cyclohydrolase I